MYQAADSVWVNPWPRLSSSSSLLQFFRTSQLLPTRIILWTWSLTQPNLSSISLNLTKFASTRGNRNETKFHRTYRNGDLMIVDKKLTQLNIDIIPRRYLQNKLEKRGRQKFQRFGFPLNVKSVAFHYLLSHSICVHLQYYVFNLRQLISNQQ